MKNFVKYMLASLLVITLICNGFLVFYLDKKKKPIPSIIRFDYGIHNTFIYCERSAEIKSIQHNYSENSFTIGKSKLLCGDDSVYFINDREKIRLEDYEGYGFVINSEGELLYSMNTPVKKQEKVYITPSGKKYHRDMYCAGRTGFEMPIETAKLLREPRSLCA